MLMSFHIGMFSIHLLQTLVYIDAKPVSNSAGTSCHVDWRKAKYTRGGLILSTIISLSLGLPLMVFWQTLDMVRVKHLEYVAVIVPAQIVIGIVVASIVQAYNGKGGTLQSDSGTEQIAEIGLDEKKVARGDDWTQYTSGELSESRSKYL